MKIKEFKITKNSQAAAIKGKNIGDFMEDPCYALWRKRLVKIGLPLMLLGIISHGIFLACTRNDVNTLTVVSGIGLCIFISAVIWPMSYLIRPGSLYLWLIFSASFMHSPSTYVDNYHNIHYLELLIYLPLCILSFSAFWGIIFYILYQRLISKIPTQFRAFTLTLIVILAGILFQSDIKLDFFFYLNMLLGYLYMYGIPFCLIIFGLRALKSRSSVDFIKKRKSKYKNFSVNKK